MHIVVQIAWDDGRAEVGVYAPVTFIVTDVERLAEIPAATDVVPVQAVGPLDIGGGGADGDGRTVMLEGIQDDCGVFGDNLQALFLVDPVSERDFAGNDGAMLYLAVQDNADSLPAQVRFILRNGKAEVDI